MSVPRIAPGSRGEVGLINFAIARIGGRVSRTEPPKLFLTMGRQRGLFRGWLRFAGRLMPGGKLPRRETELVILRVAHLRSCPYEFDHHVRLGRRAGVSEADLERLLAGPHADGWSPRERAILAAVDGLQRDRTLDDETWTALREQLNERETVELLMLAGHYDMLATFINTLRIEPDRHV